MLEGAGIEVVVTSYMAPNCNANAERFVLSIKTECLDRMIFFDQRFPRAVVAYIDHYNEDRPHQGIGNVPTSGASNIHLGRVRCRERLGGIIKRYYRVSA